MPWECKFGSKIFFGTTTFSSAPWDSSMPEAHTRYRQSTSYSDVKPMMSAFLYVCVSVCWLAVWLAVWLAAGMDAGIYASRQPCLHVYIYLKYIYIYIYMYIYTRIRLLDFDSSLEGTRVPAAGIPQAE